MLSKSCAIHKQTNNHLIHVHRGKKVGTFVPFREPVVYTVKDGKGDLLKLRLGHVARFLETLAEEATKEINTYGQCWETYVHQYLLVIGVVDVKVDGEYEGLFLNKTSFPVTNFRQDSCLCSSCS